jgi:hypothetical protein
LKGRIDRFEDIPIANTDALVRRFPRELVPAECQTAVSMIETFETEIDLRVRFSLLA